MPLYDYECKCGNVIERFFPITDRKAKVFCSACGKTSAKRIINCGGIQSDDNPPELRGKERAGTLGALQDTDRIMRKQEKPLETRSELKAYCKANGFEATG